MCFLPWKKNTFTEDKCISFNHLTPGIIIQRMFYFLTWISKGGKNSSLIFYTLFLFLLLLSSLEELDLYFTFLFMNLPLFISDIKLETSNTGRFFNAKSQIIHQITKLLLQFSQPPSSLSVINVNCPYHQ